MLNNFYKVGLLAFFQLTFFTQAQKLDTIIAQNFQSILDQKRTDNELKGVTAAVIFPNDEIWQGSSGISSATDSIVPEMLLGIGSNTKLFIASLVMLLAEDSILDISDSIHKYIDNYNYVDSNITIKQLLNHTSGLYNFTDDPLYIEEAEDYMDSVFTPEMILSTYMDMPYFNAGTDFHYANTSYIVLGMIIKSATGNTVSEELHNRILNPLQLSSTFLDQEDSLIGELAHAWYDVGLSQPIDLNYIGLPRTSLYTSMWTAGAMFSTAGEMVKWGKSLFTGEVVAQNSLQQMLDFIPGAEYGLGVTRYYIEGKELWGHGGDVIYQSLLTYYPVDSICLVILINDGTCTSSERKSFIQGLLQEYDKYFYTGINKKIASDNISVYPNPAKDYLSITFKEENINFYELSIYDSSGKLLSNKIKQPGDMVSINNLNDGLYLLYINSDNFSYSKRFIKHTH